MKKFAIAPALLTFSIVLITIWITPVNAAPKDGVHRVVIHVDDNDSKRMNMALNYEYGTK